MSSLCRWAALCRAASADTGPQPARARSMLTRATSWWATPARGGGAGCAAVVAGESVPVGRTVGVRAGSAAVTSGAGALVVSEGRGDGEAEVAVDGVPAPTVVADGVRLGSSTSSTRLVGVAG